MRDVFKTNEISQRRKEICRRNAESPPQSFKNSETEKSEYKYYTEAMSNLTLYY